MRGDMGDLSKWELIAEIGQAFDERDRLIDVCNAQEKQLRNYKVMDGSGELDDFTVRIVEYSRRLMYEKVEDYWGKSVKIIDNEDGYKAESYESWMKHAIDNDKVPPEFSVVEIRDYVAPYASKRYESYKMDAIEKREEELRKEREAEEEEE